MTNYTRLIVIIIVLLAVKSTYSQSDFNDLYYANLKGKVKSVSTTTVSYDSTSWTFGYDKRIKSDYNRNGYCEKEFEYLDTNLIQKRVNVFQNINGREKRIKKITTHSADTLNKTISYYYFDNIGFDTSIIVCASDSSYHMSYLYQRNENGLRTKGSEFNTRNGNKNYSFEIYYSKSLLTDSIIYRNGSGKINYIEYDFYNSNDELEKMKYSSGGMTVLVYKNSDKHGNWIEKETYYEENGNSELVNRQIRLIEYY